MFEKKNLKLESYISSSEWIDNNFLVLDFFSKNVRIRFKLNVIYEVLLCILVI